MYSQNLRQFMKLSSILQDDINWLLTYLIYKLTQDAPFWNLSKYVK